MAHAKKVFTFSYGLKLYWNRTSLRVCTERRKFRAGLDLFNL